MESGTPSVTAEPTGLVMISGGSAANDLAATLAENSLSATHIITVFDNGGSSGRLREVLAAPAIGDLRNRLTAIAQPRTESARCALNLFERRLHGEKLPLVQQGKMRSLIDGTSSWLAGIPDSVRAEISDAIRSVSAALDKAAGEFDWRDASIGNLLLIGRRLHVGDWNVALRWAHNILDACGLVLPITTESAHLGARLANDRYVLGQRMITSKAQRIECPIRTLHLHRSDRCLVPEVSVGLGDQARDAIRNARSIVYTWGSFYTSIFCSFLVKGFAGEVAANLGPKVLLLNPVRDEETIGKDAIDLVRELTTSAQTAGGAKVLTHVLVFKAPSERQRIEQNILYSERTRDRIESLGVRVEEMEFFGFPEKGSQQMRAIVDYLRRIGTTDDQQP